ncbi:DUF6194 family protein, partial [Actinomycetospora sp. C-140]
MDICCLGGMDADEIVTLLAAQPGTLIVEANGDVFAVHDPDGTYAERPRNGWATLVTSDAHDTASDLDRPGVFRLNLGLPRARQAEVLDGRTDPAEHDLTARDVLMPHPVYGRLGWVCVLNPESTWPTVRGLIDEAHAHAAR